MKREDYLGEWKHTPPEPSPGPWRYRESRQRRPFGREGWDTVYVVTDAKGRSVAEFDREVDAALVCSMRDDRK